MRQRTALSICILLVMLLGACSSTNHSKVAGSKGNDTTASSTTGKSKGSTSLASAGPGGTTRSGATVTGGGGGGTTSGTQTALPGAPPGVTGSIRVGFHYSRNLDAAYKAFGANGKMADVPAAIQAMVNYMNTHGGLAGKKIIPVMWGTDPLRGTFPAQAEAACTYFAEDQHAAFVVSGAVLPDDTMPACFAKHNLPLVWSYQYVLGKDIYDRYPNLYMPHNIGTYRSSFIAQALKDAGYFDPGSKVGIVRYDTPIHKQYSDVLHSGLAKIGIGVAAEAALHKPQSAGEAGDTSQDAASAILKFNQAHVNHVIFVPSGGAIPLIWGPSADGQAFYARNTFTSLDIPAFVTDNMSDQQLNRAMVVGWMPVNDTYVQYEPKTPALAKCNAASGIKATGDVVRFCDGLFFLDAALRKNPQFDPAGLHKATDLLGTSFQSPWTMSTKFGSGRHDGASSYQMMSFNGDCGCFKYIGAKKPAP